VCIPRSLQEGECHEDGLGITEKDWDTSVKYLTATLDELNVPAKEKSELLTDNLRAQEGHRREAVARIRPRRTSPGSGES